MDVVMEEGSKTGRKQPKRKTKKSRRKLRNLKIYLKKGKSNRSRMIEMMALVWKQFLVTNNLSH